MIIVHASIRHTSTHTQTSVNDHCPLTAADTQAHTQTSVNNHCPLTAADTSAHTDIS